MTDVCFNFEVHQPFRLKRGFFWGNLGFRRVAEGGLFSHYFDLSGDREIFARAAGKCYLPANRILLEEIDRSKAGGKKFKVSFSLSGVFLEQCEMWSRDLLGSFKSLFESGCVEFLDQTYYHSLAGLWEDKAEWVEQVKKHREAVKSLLGAEPSVIENTELLFNSTIAKTAEELGYRGIFAEGVARSLQGCSPNYVFKVKGCHSIRVLFRNYQLTDDMGFRFSSRQWPEWPLTADKYVSWLANTPGQCINIFADYETFGEHHWPESGIHEFLRHLPREISRYEHLHAATPSEVIASNEAVGEVDADPVGGTTSWADLERDTSCWLGNPMQWACYQRLKDLGHVVREDGSNEVLRLWRFLQVSDHLYYMFTGGGGPGEVHNYFSHYNSPWDAFVNFVSVLLDFQARLFERNVVASTPFRFTSRVGKGVFEVWSLKGLFDALRPVDLAVLDYHMARGDLVRWVKDGLQDLELAEALSSLSGVRGDELRISVAKAVRASIVRRLGRHWLSVGKGVAEASGRHIKERPARALKSLPTWRNFWFHIGEGVYTGVWASDLPSFLEGLRNVEAKSVEFHSPRGDFEHWLREAFGEHDLAENLGKAAGLGLSGEELREHLCQIVVERIRQLESSPPS